MSVNTPVMLFLFSKVIQEVHMNCETTVCQINITDTNTHRDTKESLLLYNFNY